MSALARYFKQRGDEVSGYDRVCSPLTEQLEHEEELQCIMTTAPI